MSEFIMAPFSHIQQPPYNGEDGFGDADLPEIPERVEAEHSVLAIIRLAEQYKGKLTIIALGPLTNLAMAVKIKPEIKGFIKEVFILGGNMDGLGNATPSAEFNFLVDPEAAAIALDSYPPCPLIILPWEICLTATSTYVSKTHIRVHKYELVQFQTYFENQNILFRLKEFRTETVRNLNTPQVQLMDAVEAKNLELNRESWLVADGILMSCALDNSIILEKQDHFARVEVDGTLTRGMLVVDKARIVEDPPNVQLITRLNVPAFETLLLWAAGGPPPTSSDRFKKPRL
ncbi:unnamed protein product [Orchesella dallaii]|uniref:Inosine/uridine-preferring nucleoside hydrolase domain-containing protein n=1 Tax=Orchesella dallaii TaxID=48710 RepID=A0ABP1QT47_9HEXA